MAQFQIWATQTLKEYMKKGFVLDDERLPTIFCYYTEQVPLCHNELYCCGDCV